MDDFDFNFDCDFPDVSDERKRSKLDRNQALKLREAWDKAIDSKAFPSIFALEKKLGIKLQDLRVVLRKHNLSSCKNFD